jgi:hypothetical protein
MIKIDAYDAAASMMASALLDFEEEAQKHGQDENTHRQVVDIAAGALAGPKPLTAHLYHGGWTQA